MALTFIKAMLSNLMMNQRTDRGEWCQQNRAAKFHSMRGNINNMRTIQMRNFDTDLGKCKHEWDMLISYLTNKNSTYIGDILCKEQHQRFLNRILNTDNINSHSYGSRQWRFIRKNKNVIKLKIQQTDISTISTLITYITNKNE